MPESASLPPAPPPLDPHRPPPVIQLRHVTCGYGTVPILRELSFDICEGEVFVIIGGSGSGKTTLLRTLIGFAQVLEGDLWILGQHVTTLRESAWSRIRERMGMVFQKAALFDSLTVYENVAFPLVERYPKMKPKEVAQRVFDILDSVNLGGTESLYPNEISGGQAKRVGLARALIDKPKILLYDEPTSGLDPVMTANVDGLILQAKAQYEVTSVVVSHDMNSVWRIADRVVVLHERRLLALGTPEEIQSHPDDELQQFIGGRLPLDNPLGQVLEQYGHQRPSMRERQA